MKQAAGQQGFSLVEVMVSMVVLGKLAMDSLKVAHYDSLAAGSDTVVSRYIRSWRVTRMEDAAGNPTGRKRIDVTVHWPRTAEHVLSFTSVLSDGRYKEDR